MLRPVLLCLLTVACAPKVTLPAPDAAPTVAPAEAVAQVAAPFPMMAPLGHDHPLLGRIWQPMTQRFVTEAELLADLRTADVVLLGEKHDNPDHHALQARLITAVAPQAVAFEMLDASQDVAGASDADGLAAAVDWADSGWPEFAMYRPVFEAVYAVGAQVLPGNPTDDQVQVAMREGLDALPGDALAGLRRDVVLSDRDAAAMHEEIVASHCGHAPEEMVSMMMRGQRAKDLFMARALDAVQGHAVLVAGGGHTQRAGGVPIYLRGSSRVVAFHEVDDDRLDALEYNREAPVKGYEAVVEDDGTPNYAPADYVWFTARVDDLDPCERFRAQLEAMRPTEPAAQP